MQFVSRQSPTRSTIDHGYVVIRNTVSLSDCEELMYSMFDFIINQPRIKSLQLAAITASNIESQDLYYYRKSWVPVFTDGTVAEMIYLGDSSLNRIYDLVSDVKSKFVQLYGESVLTSYDPVPIIRTPFSGQLKIHTERHTTDKLYTGYLALTPQFKTISIHKIDSPLGITFHDPLAVSSLDVWLNPGDIMIYDEHLPREYPIITEKRLDCGIIFGWKPTDNTVANQTDTKYYYNFRPFRRYPQLYTYNQKMWNRYVSRIPLDCRADLLSESKS